MICLLLLSWLEDDCKVWRIFFQNFNITLVCITLNNLVVLICNFIIPWQFSFRVHHYFDCHVIVARLTGSLFQGIPTSYRPSLYLIESCTNFTAFFYLLSPLIVYLYLHFQFPRICVTSILQKPKQRCQYQTHHIRNNSLHKRRRFSLSISSVHVTKYVVFCGFCHIYWRYLWCYKNWHVTIENSESKKFLNSGSHFFLYWRLRRSFKILKRNISFFERKT